MAKSDIQVFVTSDQELLKHSKNLLVIFLFQKSASKSFKTALALAEQATHFEKRLILDEEFYVAGFDRSQGALIKATAISKMILGWKNTFVLAGGRALPWSVSVSSILDCYQTAQACANPKAHCLTTAETQNNNLTLRQLDEERNHYHVLPCHYLKSSEFYRINPYLPVSLHDQIQAAAVNAGCEWCPNFNMDHYQYVRGERRRDSDDEEE